jgi:hypothetical protein
VKIRINLCSVKHSLRSLCGVLVECRYSVQAPETETCCPKKGYMLKMIPQELETRVLAQGHNMLEQRRVNDYLRHMYHNTCK